jgi:hypothetical protein
MSAWFHPLAAALLVTPAFASPVRTQTLASADAVPEGLSAPEWLSIRQSYNYDIVVSVIGGLVVK